MTTTIAAAQMSTISVALNAEKFMTCLRIRQGKVVDLPCFPRRAVS